MLNSSNAHGGEDSVGRDKAPNARRRAPSLTDREVPLDPARSMASLHAWLDGEGSAAAVTESEGAEYVDLWNRINTDAERRRQVTAPVDLTARIMAALPADVPQAAADSWWDRPLTLKPLTAIAAAAGLVALGAAIGSTTRDR
jgi:hypothetical protein